MNREKKISLWDGHYLGNGELFKAVNFALKMINDGVPFSEAIGKSSHYYKIPVSTLALEFMVKDYMERKNK